MAELVRLPEAAMAALRVRSAQGLPQVGRSAFFGSDRIIAVGPDEWLAVAEDSDAPALCSRLESFGGVTVDVSGNRISYRLAGPDTRWSLSAGCSIDLERLKPNDAVSALVARAQVIVIAEEGGGFLLLPRRSFAGYLEAWAAV